VIQAIFISRYKLRVTKYRRRENAMYVFHAWA